MMSDLEVYLYNSNCRLQRYFCDSRMLSCNSCKRKLVEKHNRHIKRLLLEEIKSKLYIEMNDKFQEVYNEIKEEVLEDDGTTMC